MRGSRPVTKVAQASTQIADHLGLIAPAYCSTGAKKTDNPIGL